MISPESPPPDLAWKLPGWQTFWGAHLPGSRFPPLLTSTVVSLTLAALVYTLAGGPRNLGLPPALAGFASLMLPWTRVVCALIIAALAWGIWLTRGGVAALLVAVLLPSAALLAAHNAYATWTGLTALDPGDGTGATPYWLGGGLGAAIGVQLAWLGPWLERRLAGLPRARRHGAAAALGAASLATSLGFLRADAGLHLSDRLLDGGDVMALALFALALPAMARLHRCDPGPLTHAVLLGLMPLMGAQIALLTGPTRVAGLTGLTGLTLMVRLQTALAYLTLLAGVMLDSAATYRATARARVELQEKERHLATSTRELQRIDAALAAREADYRQLVEGANDLIQSMDVDGRLRFVNRAWLETLGYGHDEAAALSAWDVIDPEEHAHCREVLSRILGQGRPERVETVFRAKSGDRVHVEGNLGVCSGEGEAVATMGIFRDVSERQRVERMKQDFLATISHELRTPLTSILGSLSLVRSPSLDGRRAGELLEIAERNGERLLRLINDLLDLQRLEAGELRFQPQAVPLGPLLAEAVHDIQGFADLYAVRVRATTEGAAGVDAAPASVVTDRNRMAQVLYNLLSNAIKFSPVGEEVLLAASARGGWVDLTVSDHGPGISDQLRGRLFEKFVQAEDAQIHGRGGSGLGLYISKKIVEGLGGTISADSADSAPGSGTTVTVRLPAAPAAVP